MPNLASLQPLSLYICLPLFVALPWDIAYLRSRMLFLSTLRRVLLPVQAVTLGVSVPLVFLRTPELSQKHPCLKGNFYRGHHDKLGKNGFRHRARNLLYGVQSCIYYLCLRLQFYMPDRISGHWVGVDCGD